MPEPSNPFMHSALPGLIQPLIAGNWQMEMEFPPFSAIVLSPRDSSTPYFRATILGYSVLRTSVLLRTPKDKDTNQYAQKV